jgi:ATP-GRASP peptide maturase of grasp-with-spasm system
MKNAFILSDEEDNTTDVVLDWLIYLKKKYVRLNDTNKLSKPCILIGDDVEMIKFKLKDDEFNLSDFDYYWYRRGAINFEYKLIDLENKNIQRATDFSIRNEISEIVKFLNLTLESKNKIGSFYDNHTNKLYNLKIAKKHELNIPQTLVTNDKKELVSFLIKHKRIITKPLGQSGLYYSNDEFYIDGLTAEITAEIIDQLPDDFQISLFQKYIPKKYELRIFYLKGNCYSSAIFSQLDKQTEIDFRNYNREKPNRVCVFNLPKNIENKIQKLMYELSMDSGSIDMIVNESNEYVFLEVNPVGQFAQVSYPCNYYLEKKVAETIINEF